jgi:hypothetical protein
LPDTRCTRPGDPLHRAYFNGEVAQSTKARLTSKNHAPAQYDVVQ